MMNIPFRLSQRFDSVRLLILGAAILILISRRTLADDLPVEETGLHGSRTSGRIGGDDDFRIPRPYPTTFQIQFDTNITKSHADDAGGGDPSKRSHHPIRGKLYYDWTRQVQRIDHGPGSYECLRFYQVESGCTLLFRPEGMYRILGVNNNYQGEENGDINDAREDNVDCCLDLPNLGTPPPDWASKATSTWKGMVWDEYGQVFAMEWWFDQFVDGALGWGNQYLSRDVAPKFHKAYRTDNDGSNDDDINEKNSSTTGTITFHTVRQVAFAKDGIDDGLPLVFTFPSLAEGRQDIHFLYNTMNHSLPNDSSLFELPEGCANKRCLGGTTQTI